MAENMATHAHAHGVRADSIGSFEDASLIAQPDIYVDYAVMEKLKISPWWRPIFGYLDVGILGCGGR